MNVELEDFCEARHVALVRKWADEPQVARWWGPPETIMNEVRSRSGEQQAIIAVDGRPVGYLCWQNPTRKELTDAGLDDLPSDLVDIDIMIGEKDAVGCGIGPEALRILFGRLRTEGVGLAGLAGAAANSRAMRAYEKAGCRAYRDFVENGEAYRYFTIALDATEGRV